MLSLSPVSDQTLHLRQRRSRRARWIARILVMLLGSLCARALLSDPTLPDKVAASFIQMNADLEAERTAEQATAPPVRAMPGDRVPVRRGGTLSGQP